MPKKVLIIAGGTGGHIFPAIAIANELKKHNSNIVWLGTTKGLENTIVINNNIKLYKINAVGLRNKSLFHLLKAPFLLTFALLKAIILIIKIK